MDTGEIKKRFQEHFTDGLVTIVGSGLSMDSGLPGMKELAEHLLDVMKKRCRGKMQKQWEPIAAKIAEGNTLEEALKDISLDNPVIEHVVDITAMFIESREREVIRKVYSGEMRLPFTSLLPHLSFNNDRVNIVTSNYDRLIELAAEIAGCGVDTLFPGQYYGKFDPELSKESLWTGRQAQKGKSIKRVYRKHVVVLKPHGSLDWFSHNGQPIRCTLPIQASRLMITPGRSKYRMGYEQPFDRHRDAANRAIDNAARLLVIGYGFNDDQLETHLKPEIRKGKPCVILTKFLTDNGVQMLQECKSILAVCSNDKGDSKIIYDGKELVLPESSVWNLENFVKEILE
ncbi:MAG: SIR2 family protein [Planctomycetota bacterium]|jgi:hypothetical protein